MKFAVANQFFMIADQAGVDYTNVLHAIRRTIRGRQICPLLASRPARACSRTRCSSRPSPSDHFPLGQAAMQVNEGLPAYVVSALERRYGGLSGRPSASSGMAFKAESDDPRASLSYKLRKLLVVGGSPRRLH